MLKFEVEDNLSVLKDSEFLLDNTWDSKATLLDLVNFIGKCLMLVPLRKAAIENLMKVENLVMINTPDFERRVLLLSEYIKKYNEYNENVCDRAELITEDGDRVKNNIQIMRLIMLHNYTRVKKASEDTKSDLVNILGAKV